MSLRGVIEDPDFTETVTHRPDASYEQDGRVVFDLGASETLDALITQPDASPFEITATGQQDDTAFAMCAMRDLGIREDARIGYDKGGFEAGETPFRAVEVRPTRFDGDEFAWYRLIEDTRGEPESDSGGDSGGIR